MRQVETVKSKQIMELIRRQNFRCALSNRLLTPETASLDHIVPLGRGGEHSIANIWIVDHQVNAAKGTMTKEEFTAMCAEVVVHQGVAPGGVPMVPSGE